MSRFSTRQVFIGKVGVGKNNPVRIQSMTTTNTNDIDKTVCQIKQLYDHGCEMARVTVQGMKEALSCELIKNNLVREGYDIPLIADIHFFPPAAITVVDFVDKVRINPGNFAAPRASLKTLTYTEEKIKQEKEKIYKKFVPLIEKCKKQKKAMRIGVNHGSLSDRILNLYGNTPKGMVICAFEYAQICREYDFHDFLFSMKSSHPLIMRQAYKLLVEEMKQYGWDYPLHLGVTEAGEGIDGRIKSSLGIGSLLLEGIGDTIRVSLTENPVNEIPPAYRLVHLAKWYEDKENEKKLDNTKPSEYTVFFQVDEKEKEHFLIQKHLQEKKIDSLLTKESENIVKLAAENPSSWNSDSFVETSKLIVLSVKKDPVRQTKQFIYWLNNQQKKFPVILYYNVHKNFDDLVIFGAAEIGSLLNDGLINGFVLPTSFDLSKRLLFTLSLLQAAKIRITKTEYISCPGCGRTLFDLPSITKKIHEKTAHLSGVNIAIMGCIVNGPGEMADADFGYVGSRPGKIDLYVGKICVEKNIDQEEAVDKLIALIKKHNKWKEAKNTIVS